ncbi:hypothetical protein GGE45_005434 [Rhizobium aethiopicum]|nr:hypothetical protein [Rhizobium aethiopicum]
MVRVPSWEFRPFSAVSHYLGLYFDNPGAIITSNLIILVLSGYGAHRA